MDPICATTATTPFPTCEILGTVPRNCGDCPLAHGDSPHKSRAESWGQSPCGLMGTMTGTVPSHAQCQPRENGAIIVLSIGRCPFRASATTDDVCLAWSVREMPPGTAFATCRGKTPPAPDSPPAASNSLHDVVLRCEKDWSMAAPQGAVRRSVLRRRASAAHPI